jgi:hypothetical protein
MMNDSRQVQMLAERLLGAPYTLPFGRPQNARLVLGEVPEEIPLAPPIPAGGSVLGSVARQADGQLVNVDILVDLPSGMTAMEALAFYERELPARGWAAAPAAPSGMRGGFQFGPGGLSRTFCRDEAGPWVSVTVGAQGGSAEARLHLDLTSPGPCAQPGRGDPPGGDLLPPLRAPDGVSLLPLGGSFGSDQVVSQATLASESPATDLERHFAAQLLAAGWERIDDGADGPLAWSRWRLPRRGAWYGSLTVLEEAEARQRFLVVRAALARAASGGWIGTSQSTIPRA